MSLSLLNLPSKPVWPFTVDVDYAKDLGVIAWWPGTSQGGKKMLEVAGRGSYHGNLVNSASWVFGKDGGSALKATRSGTGGLNSCAETTFKYTPLSTAPYTFSAWVYPRSLTSGGGEQDLFGSRDDASSSGMYFRFNETGGAMRAIHNTKTPIADSNGTIYVVDTWQHILITYNGSTVDFYRNGVAWGAGVSVGAATNTTAQGFNIGANNDDGTNRFGSDANVEDVIFCNRYTPAHRAWQFFDPATRWALRYQPGRTKWFLGNAQGGGGVTENAVPVVATASVAAPTVSLSNPSGAVSQSGTVATPTHTSQAAPSPIASTGSVVAPAVTLSNAAGAVTFTGSPVAGAGTIGVAPSPVTGAFTVPAVVTTGGAITENAQPVVVTGSVVAPATSLLLGASPATATFTVAAPFAGEFQTVSVQLRYVKQRTRLKYLENRHRERKVPLQ